MYMSIIFAHYLQFIHYAHMCMKCIKITFLPPIYKKLLTNL